MDKSPEPQEEPLLNQGAPLDIPVWFRIVCSAVALLLIVPATVLFIRYSLEPERFATPTALGLHEFVLGGVILLLVALTPWKSFGLRLRKVGILEFEKVVSGQAAEHAEEVSELRTRLNELEATTRGLNEIAPISEHLEDVNLLPVVARFLIDNQPIAFSPLRMRDWGSRQPGFDKLQGVSLSSLRRMLQKLVADGRATTKVSRLGNTLYRAASP